MKHRLVEVRVRQPKGDKEEYSIPLFCDRKSHQSVRMIHILIMILLYWLVKGRYSHFLRLQSTSTVQSSGENYQENYLKVV